MICADCRHNIYLGWRAAKADSQGDTLIRCPTCFIRHFARGPVDSKDKKVEML